MRLVWQLALTNASKSFSKDSIEFLRYCSNLQIFVCLTASLYFTPLLKILDSLTLPTPILVDQVKSYFFINHHFIQGLDIPKEHYHDRRR